MHANRRVIWAWATALVLASVGCGGGDEFGEPAPDSATFEVDWKPETVLADAKEVSDTLLEPRPDDGVYRFDPAPSSLDGVATGQIVLLPGVGLFRVMSVARPGSTLELGTEPASLLEAATRGKLSWDYGVEGGRKGTIGAVGSGGVVPLLNDAPGTPVTWSGTLGSLPVSATITPEDGQTRVEIHSEAPVATGQVKVHATGVIKGFRLQGNYEFAEGTITDFRMVAEGVDINMEGSLELQALSASAGTKFGPPLSVNFPFAVGPLPMYISIGAGFELESTLSSQSDVARVSARWAYQGRLGVQRSATGELSVVAGAPSAPALSAEGGEQVTRITSGVGLLLEAPRLEVGAGLPPRTPGADIANAHLVFKLKHEAVSNLEVQHNVITGLTRSCYSVSVNAGASFGGGVRMLGFSYATETPLWGRTSQPIRRGDGC